MAEVTDQSINQVFGSENARALSSGSSESTIMADTYEEADSENCTEFFKNSKSVGLSDSGVVINANSGTGFDFSGTLVSIDLSLLNLGIHGLDVCAMAAEWLMKGFEGEITLVGFEKDPIIKNFGGSNP